MLEEENEVLKKEKEENKLCIKDLQKENATLAKELEIYYEIIFYLHYTFITIGYN